MCVPLGNIFLLRRITMWTMYISDWVHALLLLLYILTHCTGKASTTHCLVDEHFKEAITKLIPSISKRFTVSMDMHVLQILGLPQICRPNWIKIHGYTYHNSEFVLCYFQEDDVPVFGKIDIIVITGTPLFSLKMFTTLGINNHLLCFVIKCSHQSSFVCVSQLKFPEPLSAHSCIGDSNIYVALRSHVQNIAQWYLLLN